MGEVSRSVPSGESLAPPACVLEALPTLRERAGLVYDQTWLRLDPWRARQHPAPTLGWPGRDDRHRHAPRGPHWSPVMSPLAVTQDQPDRLPADTVPGERPAATPGRFATREATLEQFRLRCADVHPVGCDVELVSSSRDDVVSRACSHGASAHGFTPAWYSTRRLAAIAADVAQTGRAGVAGARP